MTVLTDDLADVINEALFKDKPDTLVVAWLGNNQWVVIDVENQETTIVSVGDAQVVPKAFIQLAQERSGLSYHFVP